MSAAGLIASIKGTRQRKKAEKALDRELANAPKYDIASEAYENQAIARNQAYGRDRSLQMAAEDIDQGVSDAASQARSVSSSSSALLSTIAQINAGRNQQLRGLAQDDAMLRSQRVQNLQNVNQQMIDEKDKAWNYNINMPFQMRVAKYRDQAKVGSEMEMAGVAAQAQTEAAFASSLGSMLGGMASDARLKDNIQPFEKGLEIVEQLNPVTFDYIHPRYADGRTHIGFIAQDIQKVVPEVVSVINGMAKEGEIQYLKIDYHELVPALVNAIKELQAEVRELKQSHGDYPLGHFIPGTKLEEMGSFSK